MQYIFHRKGPRLGEAYRVKPKVLPITAKLHGCFDTDLVIPVA